MKLRPEIGLYDHRVHGVSQSILTTFMSCRMKSKLKLDGWRHIKPGDAMLFGTLAHDVIGNAFAEFDAPPSNEWVKGELKKAMAKVIEEHGGRLGGSTLDGLSRSTSVLLGILPMYFEHYKSEFGRDTWIYVESNFRANFAGVPFPMVGRYDRVRRIGGRPWLYETKTKSRIEDDYLTEMLHFDIQNGVYLEAIMAGLREVPAGVVYDVLRNPGLKKGVKETESAFIDRIIDDVADRPEHYFVRYEVAIDAHEMKSFGRELAAIANDFDMWRKGLLPTWKNTTACKTSYGMCEMIPICSRGDYSNFVKRKEMFPELARETKQGGSQ